MLNVITDMLLVPLKCFWLMTCCAQQQNPAPVQAVTAVTADVMCSIHVQLSRAENEKGHIQLLSQ